MITNCDLLMVADSNNDAALSEMADRARILMEEPRFITATVFRLAGDKWQPHEFAKPHPLSVAFANIQKLELARNYADQREGLQIEVGDELRVTAQKAGTQPDDDTMYLYASWIKTVPQALPKSDFIMLFDLDEPNMVTKVPWQALVDVAGLLLQPMGTFPARYRVEQFPNAQQLAELQRRADVVVVQLK